MSIFKRPFFVLLLESHVARLYGGTANDFSELAAFTPDAAGQAQLGAWLQTRHAPAVRLLVNLPEAIELRESIPCLRGGERHTVLTRKLRQRFGDNPFIMATSLGVETVGPRQEEILRLVALPHTILQGWIEALRRTPLAGVYDAPQLIAELARRQRFPPVCLILTVHQDAIRQTLLSAERILFSRLLSSPPKTGVDWIAEETERLRVYLSRQRLIDADADLLVCPLTQVGLQDELRQAFARPGLEKCVLHPLDFADAASDDLLLLQTLARHPPRQQYAPARLRRDYLLPFKRRAVLGAGAFILLAGALWGGISLLDARKLQAQTAAFRLEIEQAQHEYQIATSHHPALPPSFDTDTAHRLLAAYDQHVGAATPEQMLADLQTLSVWLDRHPEIHLEKLRWLEKERTLILEGVATTANFARFTRDLAQQEADHEIQQAPTEQDAAFRLFLYHRRTT